MAALLAVLEERLQAVVEDVSAKNTVALADALNTMDPPLVVRITPHVATTFRSLIGHPLAKEDTVLAALGGLRTLFRITAEAASLVSPPGPAKDGKRKQHLRTSPLDVPLHLGLLADVMQGKKLRVSPSEEIAAEALRTYADIADRHAALARELAKQPVLLGYVVYVLLAQAENADLQITTRTLALQTIRQTISLAAAANPSALAFAVPGILSSITNIITKASYVHTPLAVASVDIVSLLLAQLALATPPLSTVPPAHANRGADKGPTQRLHATIARLRLSDTHHHTSSSGNDSGGNSSSSSQGSNDATLSKHGHAVRRKSSGNQAHRQGSLLDHTVWREEEQHKEDEARRDAIVSGSHTVQPAEHGAGGGGAGSTTDGGMDHSGGNPASSSSSSSSSTSSPKQLRVPLDREWWTKAADNIVMRIALLLKALQQHQDTRVRLACVLCSFTLMRTCVPHMPGVVAPAMDFLMGAVTDSSAAVSSAAADAYAALTADAHAGRRPGLRGQEHGASEEEGMTRRRGDAYTSSQSNGMHNGVGHGGSQAPVVQHRHERQQRREVARRAQQAMQRLLHQTLVRLPRCCRTGTDEDILFALQQLGGCLCLLTPTTEAALRAGSGIKHFMGAMCTVLSFDVDEYDTLVADALASTEAGQGRHASEKEHQGFSSTQPTECTTNMQEGSTIPSTAPAAGAAPRVEGVEAAKRAQQGESGLRKVYKYHRNDAVVAAAYEACRLMAQHPSCLRDVFTHVLRHSQQQMHQQPSLVHLLISMLHHSASHSNTSNSNSNSNSPGGGGGCDARAHPAAPFSIPPSDPSFWRTATSTYLQRKQPPLTAASLRPENGCTIDDGADGFSACGVGDEDGGGCGEQQHRHTARGIRTAAERLYTLSMQPYWHRLPVVKRSAAALTATDSSSAGAGGVGGRDDDLGLSSWEHAQSIESPLPQTRLTAQELRQNVLAVCTALEALACAAEALGRSFRTKLPEALYCLLRHVVSENVVVHQTALSSLDRIARVCGCPSRFDLVGSAAPLLVGRISAFIRHLDLHPESPAALEALLRYAPPSSFSVVRNTAANVFLGLDGYHEADTTSTYLRLLFHFTKTLRRWQPELDAEHRRQHPTWRPEAGVEREARAGGKEAAMGEEQHGSAGTDAHGDASSDERKEPAMDKELAAQISEIMERLGDNPTQEKLLALREELGPALDKAVAAAQALAGEEAKKGKGKAKADATDDVDNESEQGKADSVGGGAEDGPPAPAYVHLAEQVTKRVLHFIPDPNPKVRQACLRTLEQSFLVLAPHTKQLLPLVHQSWGPLVARLDDRVLFVREAAVALLVVVCESAQDFVTRRMTKDAVPKLVALLEERGALLHEALSRFHSSVRLVSAVLRVLGRPWLDLGLSTFQQRPIVRACLPFLRSDVPLDVQTAAVGALRRLARINADVVWFGLISMWRREADQARIAATATDTSLPPRRFPQVDPRFADNVAMLLDELDKIEEEGEEEGES